MLCCILRHLVPTLVPSCLPIHTNTSTISQDKLRLYFLQIPLQIRKTNLKTLQTHKCKRTTWYSATLLIDVVILSFSVIMSCHISSIFITQWEVDTIRLDISESVTIQCFGKDQSVLTAEILTVACWGLTHIAFK